MPPKKSKKTKATVTCPHCRYEHPADEEPCSLCGYPWPWLKDGKHSGKDAKP